MQKYKQSSSAVDLSKQSDIYQQLKDEQDNKLNQRLITVLNDFQTGGMKFSKKKFNENINSMIENSDRHLEENKSKQ